MTNNKFFSDSIIKTSKAQAPQNWWQLKQSLRSFLEFFIWTLMLSVCNLYWVHNGRGSGPPKEKEDCKKQCWGCAFCYHSSSTFDLGFILSSSKSLQSTYQKYRLKLGRIMTPHKLIFEWECFIFKPCSRMKILPNSWKFKLRKKTRDMTPVWVVPTELQGNVVWTLLFCKTYYLL